MDVNRHTARDTDKEINRDRDRSTDMDMDRNPDTNTDMERGHIGAAPSVMTPG
jgi:hypothetical protein